MFLSLENYYHVCHTDLQSLLTRLPISCFSIFLVPQKARFGLLYTSQACYLVLSAESVYSYGDCLGNNTDFFNLLKCFCKKHNNKNNSSWVIYLNFLSLFFLFVILLWFLFRRGALLYKHTYIAKGNLDVPWRLLGWWHGRKVNQIVLSWLVRVVLISILSLYTPRYVLSTALHRHNGKGIIVSRRVVDGNMVRIKDQSHPIPSHPGQSVSQSSQWGRIGVHTIVYPHWMNRPSILRFNCCVSFRFLVSHANR